MDKFKIDDKRTQKDFKNMTFSKFKKSDVKKELINTIKNNKIEEACYWCAELICSGHFVDLWETIFLLLGKHIHLGNPKLPIYIDLRYTKFKELVQNGYIDNEIKMRNNNEVRELFCEVVCVLALSNKKQGLVQSKVKDNDFKITEIQSRLKADNLNYCNNIFMKEDPKELFIALNELSYHLSKKSESFMDAIYWIEWILEYEKKCQKEKKITIICERRGNIPVSNNNQKDIVWMIWDCILFSSMEKSKTVLKINKAILNLYCSRFTTSNKRKRRFLIYFAISLIVDYYNINIKMINNDTLIEKIKKNINQIYKQIKKHEIGSGTNYLFNNSFNGGNLEKTISKLNKLDSLMGMVPRNNN